jgi:glycosyltransferase involved in cell wall biosynthesis
LTNKEQPKFSIITPCYNSENFIEGAITSVLKQTYPNIEYIVVDCASTDGTMQIVEKYKDMMAKIISEPDSGISEALNKGIKVASGDIIFFLCSDDYLHDEKVIEDVADVFMDTPYLTMVYGNIELIDESIDYFSVIGKKHSLEDFKKGIVPYVGGLFARKELYVKHGAFSERYKMVNDWDLLFKFFKTNFDKSMYIQRIITVFRFGGVSSHLKSEQLFRKEASQIMKEHFGIELVRYESHINCFGYYKAWIELLLLHDKGASDVLRNQISRVAIWGCGKTALYVLKDLKRNGIQAVVFLDNNSYMQGRELYGIEIHSPDWLKMNHKLIDAIVLTFENNYDDEIRRQIDKIIPEDRLKVISWKDLIEMSCNELGMSHVRFKEFDVQNNNMKSEYI